ncbi:MAG: MarR family winged helix-turn-helix transcriptional regulator [Alphaproteobacteria bacterium]
MHKTPYWQKNLYLHDENLKQLMEIFFFSYQKFTKQADDKLAEIGLGRAHHRIIYFVGANPNISVSELLSLLKITKQSLSRVLNQLEKEGYIERRTDKNDARKRLLWLTSKGQKLEKELTAIQIEILRTACKSGGAEAVDGFKKLAFEMMEEADKQRVSGYND